MSALTDAGYLSEGNPNEGRGIVSNCLKRSLHALLRYFSDRHNVALSDYGAAYYIAEDDPRGHIRVALMVD
jgi:hypothetical protein